MIEVKSPVQASLILICEKCAKKLQVQGTETEVENLTRKMHKSLKSEIEITGKKGIVRALVSSCLDICPEGKIAAAVIPVNSPSHFYVFDPAQSAKASETLLNLAIEPNKEISSNGFT